MFFLTLDIFILVALTYVYDIPLFLVQNIFSFASVIEDEGVFGLAQSTVLHTTSFACHVALTATSTALSVMAGASDNVGRLLTGEHDDDNNVHHQKTTDNERIFKQQHNDSAPFVVKIALDITDILLGTISPMLVNGNKKEDNYHLRNRYSCGAQDFELITADTGSMMSQELFFDAASCCSQYDESIYFDAEDSLPSLSKSESFTSSSSTDNNSCDDTDDKPIPDSVIIQEEEEPTTFYLDCSDMISDVRLILSDKESRFYAISDTKENQKPFNRVLDILVERALRLAIVNDSWKAEDNTKKLLKRCNRSDTKEWNQMLEKEVLKWTNSTTMLMTEGIVNMTPLELKELLLDKDRVQLFNKSSLGKNDEYIFSNVIDGEAKIVKNVMKIPIVGSMLETLSLTHTRCMENGGFIIVSQSVSTSSLANSSSSSSISIMRPVGSDKTDLITISQFASMPIPKFLLWKIGNNVAMDFFNNLRAICASDDR